MQLIFAFIAEINASFELNKRKLAFIQPLCVSVKRQPTRKWHIWFLPTHEPTLKKPKEPFFANARTNEPTIKSKFDD